MERWLEETPAGRPPDPSNALDDRYYEVEIRRYACSRATGGRKP